MDPIIVVSVILALVGVMLGAFYVKQGLEQAEMKRAVQVAHHHKLARRLLRAFDSIPPQYSSEALQKFALQEVEKELCTILQITPANPKIRRELSIIQERLSNTKSSEPDHIDVKSLDEANDIRSHAQALLKYVHQSYQANLIAKDIARNLNNQLKKAISQTALDFYIFKARTFEAIDKHQMALPFYERAKQELLKHPFLENHAERVSVVNSKIKLISQLDQDQRESEAANESPSLDGAIDDLIQEEDAMWKKKYF